MTSARLRRPAIILARRCAVAMRQPKRGPAVAAARPVQVAGCRVGRGSSSLLAVARARESTLCLRFVCGLSTSRLRSVYGCPDNDPRAAEHRIPTLTPMLSTGGST